MSKTAESGETKLVSQTSDAERSPGASQDGGAESPEGSKSRELSHPGIVKASRGPSGFLPELQEQILSPIRLNKDNRVGSTVPQFQGAQGPRHLKELRSAKCAYSISVHLLSLTRAHQWFDLYLHFPLGTPTAPSRGFMIYPLQPPRERLRQDRGGGRGFLGGKACGTQTRTSRRTRDRTVKRPSADLVTSQGTSRSYSNH